MIVETSEAKDLSGLRAVVTGASSGIGAAICAELAGRGALVAGLARRPAPAAQFSVPLDLGDSGGPEQAMSEAISHLGGLEILINCGAICEPAPLLGLDVQSLARTLQANLVAPVMLMKLAAREMGRAHCGWIVNVTSVHGVASEPGGVAYDSSKAGLEAATRAAALDLADVGILVNAVAPGFVRTPMSIVDGVDETTVPPFTTVYRDGGKLPLRRPAQPQEVAKVVVFFASPANTYTTGQTITVDGGLLATF